MDSFSHLDFSHSRRNAFRSVYIDFSIIKSDKSKGLVFGLTGINYGKSHERGSIKRVIEYHGNKVNSNCEVFFYIMIFTIHSEMFLRDLSYAIQL